MILYQLSKLYEFTNDLDSYIVIKEGAKNNTDKWPIPTSFTLERA